MPKTSHYDRKPSGGFFEDNMGKIGDIGEA
jgi:hypothetical protein